SELYIADALLTPQQKIIWIKSLTDDNQALGVDSLKNEGKKLIGYLCYVFRNILEKDSNTPVATTGSISAGFIRGDLTLFFHQAQTGDNKEPNGQFYNCTNNEFEDYAAKKTRIYGPYSLLKSVCEAARKEFEQIVNAPAETANPKSAKGTLVKSSPTPRVPSGRS
ncbi:MAG TPA: hypothetical protein PKH37_06105, partial [Alphaproteobacteria bacterium]|nr:hypothetical protein [Alphaproteobacteria bacterium]